MRAIRRNNGFTQLVITDAADDGRHITVKLGDYSLVSNKASCQSTWLALVAHKAGIDKLKGLPELIGKKLWVKIEEGKIKTIK